MKWIETLWEPQILAYSWGLCPLLCVLAQMNWFHSVIIASMDNCRFILQGFTNYNCAPHLHVSTFLPILQSIQEYLCGTTQHQVVLGWMTAISKLEQNCCLPQQLELTRRKSQPQSSRSARKWIYLYIFFWYHRITEC